MLKVNERLDKLAAARADFTACGMLEDSCLIQAIWNTLSGGPGDLMDEDTDESDESDESNKFNCPTSDEIDVLNHTPPLDDADPLVLHSVGAYTLYYTDTRTFDNNTYAPGVSDNHIDDDNPRLPDQDSPTPPDDEEDDDHRPVESGPLMNEVRLASKKGQFSHLILKARES